MCIATLALSVLTLAFVLWFQRTRGGANIWDFQGATGAATVIPSFAGVVLAAWAIFFQIKTNSPAYKAAEQRWLEISELYHKALKINALLQTFDVEESPNETEDVSSDAWDEIEYDPGPYDNLLVRQREAQRLSVERCRREFLVNGGPDTGKSFAMLALNVFPVLESLQGRMLGAQTVSLIRLEIEIDELGAAYNHSDDEEFAFWLRQAITATGQLVLLAEELLKNGLLTVDAIEEALLSPAYSQTAHAWFEAANELAEFRRNQKPSEARQRLRDASRDANVKPKVA